MQAKSNCERTSEKICRRCFSKRRNFGEEFFFVDKILCSGLPENSTCFSKTLLEKSRGLEPNSHKYLPPYSRLEFFFFWDLEQKVGNPAYPLQKISIVVPILIGKKACMLVNRN